MYNAKVLDKVLELQGRAYSIDELDAMTIRTINRLFRAADESHLYPISGGFDATARAIRRLRRLRRAGAAISSGAEYALALDAEISRIVNTL